MQKLVTIAGELTTYLGLAILIFLGMTVLVLAIKGPQTGFDLEAEQAATIGLAGLGITLAGCVVWALGKNLQTKA